MKKINSYLGYSPNRISRVGKLSTANHSLESVVFQQGKSILDYDLNVMQDVINNSISSVASSIYKTSGFLSNVIPTLSTAFSLTLPFSDVNLMGKVFSVKSGITGNSAITASSGLGSSVNVLWWLEIWFQEIVPSGNTANAEIIGSGLAATKDTQIYLHGGETNSGIYATPTTGGPINDLLDPVFAAETTRRVQLRWRIRSSNITSSTAGFGTITSGTYSPEVGVVAQGGRSSDFAYSNANVVSTTNPFTFIRSDQSSAVISIHTFSEVSTTPSFYLSDMLYSLRDIATLMDSPLYIAGRGTDDDAQQLNTVDGRVYGLQIGISTKINTNTYSFVKTMSVPAVSSSSQILLGNTAQVTGSGYGLSLSATDATISAVSESNTVANLTISTQDASSSLSYVLAKRISLTTIGTAAKPSLTFDNGSSTRTTGLYFSSSGSAQSLNISALGNGVASFTYSPAMSPSPAITGTIQSNKNTVVVSSTAGMSAGMLLTRSGTTGAGALSSSSATTITAVLNTTTFSISPAATTAGPVDFTLGSTPAISLFGPLSTSSSIFLSAANSVPSVTITTSGITTTSTTDPSSIANLTSAAFSSAAVNITGGSISGANLNLVNSAVPSTAGRLTYGSDFTLWLGAGGSPATYKQFGYLATENISTTYTAGSGATVTWSGGSLGAIPSGVSVPSSGGGSGYKIGDQVRVSGGNNNALLSVATLTANSTAVATWTLVSGGTGYAASGTGVATSATGKTTSISGFSATIANTGTAIDVARSDHVHATPATWSPSAHAASHALAVSGTGGTDALTGNIDAIARTSIKISASSGATSGLINSGAQRRVIDVRAGANIKVDLTEPTVNTDDSMVLLISADVAGYQDTKAAVTATNTTGSGDFVPLPSTVSGSYGLVPISYLVPGVKYIIKTAGDTSLANWKLITGIASLTSGSLLNTLFTAEPFATPTQYVGTGSCLPFNQFAARREHSHPASPERSFASASTIASLNINGSGSAGADSDLTVAKGSHVHAFPGTLTARFAFGEAYSGSISDTLDISGTTNYSTAASSLFVRQKSYATPTPSAPASVVNTGGRIAFGGQTSTSDATAVGVFGAISARKSNNTDNNSSGYLSLWSSTNDTLVESLRGYSTGSIHIGSSSTYGLSGYEIASGSLQVDSQIRIGAPWPTVTPVVSAMTITPVPANATVGNISVITIVAAVGYPAFTQAYFLVKQGTNTAAIISMSVDSNGTTGTNYVIHTNSPTYTATSTSGQVTLQLLSLSSVTSSFITGSAVIGSKLLANNVQVLGSATLKSLTVADTITGNISGTAPAGSLTGNTLASNVTGSSLTSVGTLGSLTVTNAINGTLTSATTGNVDLTVLSATMASNDYFRIRVGGGTADAGYVELATADNGTEPIYVRQYSNVTIEGVTTPFGSLTRSASLLDGDGNTSFPETLSVKALKIGTAFPAAVPTISTIVLTASTSSIASITINAGASSYPASSLAYFRVAQGTNSSAIVRFTTGVDGATGTTATVFQAGTGYNTTAPATLSLLYVKSNAPSNVSTATGNIVVSNNILADSVTVLGNVGIGTTSPSQLLTVAGQVRISYSDAYTGMNISNKSASALTSGVNFVDFGNENEYAVASLWGEVRKDGGSSLGIHTTPAGERTSDRKVERMRIDYNGNVGIGTTTPAALLAVNGMVQITSLTPVWPTSGVGLELFYNASADIAQIQSYSRTGSSYKPLVFDGLRHEFRASGASVFTAESVGAQQRINISGIRTTSPSVAVQLFAKNSDISSIVGQIGTVAGSLSSWTANLTVAATSAVHVGMKVTSVATGTTAGAVGTGAIIQSITTVGSNIIAVIFSTTTSTVGSSTYSFTDLGGIHWTTYADTLSDKKTTGPREYSIWGYPERTDTGGNANVTPLNGTLITERFFDLSFPTYNEVYATGAYQYSTYSMLARFSVPVSINGHLRLRAPQTTSQQGFAGAPINGRLTLESQTTNTASSQGSIVGTVMLTSGAVTGTWAAGQVLSGTGVIPGTVVTSVSPSGSSYTVNLDTHHGLTIIPNANDTIALSGTPVIWNIDNDSGLFRIFREDWKTDTTYGGGLNGAVRLAITNAGKVGIGTTSPAATLHLSSADTQSELIIESTAASSRSTLKLLTNGNDWEIGARGSSLAPINAFYIYDFTNNAYRMTINSSGGMYVNGQISGSIAPRVFIPASAFSLGAAANAASYTSDGTTGSLYLSFAQSKIAYSTIITPHNYDKTKKIKIYVYASNTAAANWKVSMYAGLTPIDTYYATCVPTSGTNPVGYDVANSTVSAFFLPDPGELLGIKVVNSSSATYTLYGVLVVFGYD